MSSCACFKCDCGLCRCNYITKINYKNGYKTTYLKNFSISGTN